MGPHPTSAYSLHEVEQRLHQASLRERRHAREHAAAGAALRAKMVRRVAAGGRRGLAVAAATGVLVIMALNTIR